MPRFSVSVPVVHTFELSADSADDAMMKAEDMIESGNFGDSHDISGTVANEIDDSDEIDDGESEL